MNNENNENNEMKPKRKEGRTLLISSHENMDFDLQGVENVHETNNGSKFIVFNSIENAVNAYDLLNKSNVKVKYSYYKLFFRLKNVNLENVEYNELKNKIVSLLEAENINVLYFKFYTKNKVLMGSGDLTTDTKTSFDNLINLNDIPMDDGTITFFRFKIKANSSKNYVNTQQAQIN